MLNHVSTYKNPSILLKIDFSKAFDSIDWSFVLNIMKARGFSNRWLKWIEQLLQTSASRVLVNGQQSEFFEHKRGLRQGDPLSPMLFIIAVDVLQTMVQSASATLSNPISPKVPDSIVALQYANDTLIMAEGGTSTIITLKLVLRLFTKVSGLAINFDKSSYVPFNLSDEQNTITRFILGCTQQQLPLNYLGMPLTVAKPGRHLFIPLIEKIEKRLQGWKRRIISRGGRLQLVRSVLSSIPIYFMTCFVLPNWVVERIDKIRRQFLWGKSNSENRGISLVNWEAAWGEQLKQPH